MNISLPASMRKGILGILILLVCVIESKAQDKSRIDSLVNLISGTTNPTDKIDLYNQIASGYNRTDSLNTAKYAEFAIALSREINYPEGLADAYENLGTSAKATGHYPEAKAFYQKALDEAPEHDLSRIANAQNGLASICRREGNYPAALKYYLNNLELYTKADNKWGLAFTYGNMGLIYDAQEDYTKSLELRKKTLKFVIEVNDSLEIARSYHNLGVSYSQNEMLDSALYCLNKSLEIRQLLGDEYGEAKSLVNIAQTYFLLEEPQYEQAIKLLLKAEKTFQKINNKYWLVHTQSLLGKAYQETDQLNLATDYGEGAFRLAKEMEDLGEIETSSSILHGIYAESGDYERAYEYHLIYKETSDKILNEKNTEEITELAMQHEFDKEKALIAAENAKKVAFQRQVLLATLGGLLLVSLLAYYIRKGKKRSDELLHNILPEEVATELKQKGEAQAQLIDQVTVIFTDFKGFTSYAEKMSPEDLVKDIHMSFTGFDKICEKNGIEKIKTIGDAYMAAGGLPVPNSTHAEDVVKAAIEIRNFIEEGKQKKIAAGQPFFEIQIGVHTGPVVAGIVGVKKFSYDIWGDTVNTASRMESSGEIDKINISESTYDLVKDDANFKFEYRGMIKAKGKGEMKMFFVERA